MPTKRVGNVPSTYDPEGSDHVDFYTGGGGSQPNKITKVYTPTKNGLIIEDGYHEGSTIEGDPDLIGANILAGKNIFGVAGAIPDKGAGSTITPGTSPKFIGSGYWSSLHTIEGDADLIASNIKSGVNIFGVVGTLANKEFQRSSKLSASDGYFLLSGLPFTPSVVLLWTQSNKWSNLIVYSSEISTTDYKDGSSTRLIDGVNSYVTANSVLLKVQNASTLYEYLIIK